MSTYNWLSLFGVPALISAIIMFFVGILIKEIKGQKALKLGVQALLRDRLCQAIDFFEKRGWASYDEKSNVTNMYLQYEALGKNGVMTSRYKSFLELPSYDKNQQQ